MTTRLVTHEDLRRALGGVPMVVDADILSSLAHDEAEWAAAGRPIAAVRATSTSQVQQVVAACAQLEVPVVTRGAGTGLSGGANAVEGCLVLDLSKMNRILEIDADNMVAVVQPGVINDDFKAAVAERGMWYPPDPASAAWSTMAYVVESESARSDFADRRRDSNQIVVPRCRMKPETRLDDGERHILPLELRVRSAESANEFRSTDLTPDQIVRMIHHLHLIGLGVPYPELDGVGRAAL